jgi:hypothetical protein
MDDLLYSLSDRLEVWHAAPKAPKQRLSRHYDCRCGNTVYFDNTICPECGSMLGYLPDEGRVTALDPAAMPGTWTAHGRDGLLRFCANHDTPAMCNWMVAAEDELQLCRACRLNRTIPDLGDPDNARYWAKIEAAKRRVISQLIGLGSPVRSKLYDDPETGLMFDFLRSPPEGSPVMTGHSNGLITINVEEADDAKREKIRHAMREPYRTLVGHFRHELGHYYWDRLIWDRPWLEPFRELFGDERASYAEALKRNYEHGPPDNWAESYVSAYATMHPWEDWAETCAHYLHIVDSLTTAMGFGLDANDVEGGVEFLGKDALYAPDDRHASRFLELLNGWREISVVLNEMARSMGQPDFYPFVLSKPAVAKLQFVQIVVSDARAELAALNAAEAGLESNALAIGGSPQPRTS